MNNYDPTNRLRWPPEQQLRWLHDRFEVTLRMRRLGFSVSRSKKRRESYTRYYELTIGPKNNSNCYFQAGSFKAANCLQSAMEWLR